VDLYHLLEATGIVVAGVLFFALAGSIAALGGSRPASSKTVPATTVSRGGSAPSVTRWP
jgi:hypothetical protein